MQPCVQLLHPPCVWYIWRGFNSNERSSSKQSKIQTLKVPKIQHAGASHLGPFRCLPIGTWIRITILLEGWFGAYHLSAECIRDHLSWKTTLLLFTVHQTDMFTTTAFLVTCAPITSVPPEVEEKCMEMLSSLWNTTVAGTTWAHLYSFKHVMTWERIVYSCNQNTHINAASIIGILSDVTAYTCIIEV